MKEALTRVPVEELIPPCNQPGEGNFAWASLTWGALTTRAAAAAERLPGAAQWGVEVLGALPDFSVDPKGPQVWTAAALGGQPDTEAAARWSQPQKTPPAGGPRWEGCAQHRPALLQLLLVCAP